MRVLCGIVAARHVAAVAAAAVFVAGVIRGPAQAQDAAADADETAREASSDEEAPAAANPLGELIRGLFPKPEAMPERVLPIEPGQENEAVPEDENAPVNGDRTARDRTDARAPYDPEQAKLLRVAASHIQRAKQTGEGREWEAAVAILERVLEGESDSLVRLDDGSWVSVRLHASRTLADLPAEYLELYRRNNAELARKLLEQARIDGDVDLLHALASRFINTEAGQEAADVVATLHFDRGEFGIAARWFRQLLEFEAGLTREPAWRLKAALAFRQSGDRPSEESVLAGLPQETTIPLGGGAADPAEWLEQAYVPAAPRVTLDEWPMFLGNASHTGAVAGGEPLLLARWNHSLTYSHAVQEQIETLLADLSDAETAAIPAFSPLMVDGKVIFRTLRGVHVVDAGSGRLLWETRLGIAPERILSGAADESQGDGILINGAMAIRGQRQVWVNGRLLDEYAGMTADQHPLTRLLLSDGVYGLISSDGRQLFAIEEHAVLLPFQHSYRWGWSPMSADPYRRDLTTNKIVSYDLASGRPRWEVGGTAMDEPFDLRLAGYYFLGAPVSDGGDLFAVGEKDNEIRLFCLDAEMGRPRWSQLVAYSDTKIEQDSNRRYWTAQPAVSSGVIVVPTTAGWLVAIDRMSHSVLWAHRYFPPNSGEPAHEHGIGFAGAYGNDSLIPINATWGPSAPVISGNRVVFTPPEAYNPYDPGNQQPMVVCLDLFDGSMLWQRPKDETLYLAGVYGERALLVGNREVTSVAMSDGRVHWTRSIPYEAGRPSGRGLAVGDNYLLPLSSGELWSLGLDDGKVVSRTFLPAGSAPLGNLGMYEGMLLSLSPLAMTAFEQRDAILEQIADRKAKDPRDAWALLREADIHLLNREHSEALRVLRQIDAAQVPAEQRAHYRRAMIDSLEAVVRADLTAHDAEMEELAALVETDDELLIHARLRAEMLQSRGDYRRAFELYLELARDGRQSMIVRGDDAAVRVAVTPWVAGRLADLWRDMPEEVREALDPAIASAAEEALAGEAEARERFVALFAFHAEAVRVRQRLVEDFADAGSFLRAERELLRLASLDDASIAAAALARLGRLMSDAGLTEDAAHFEGLLAERYPDATLAVGPEGEGIPVREWVAQRGNSTQAAAASWTGREIELRITQTNQSPNPCQELPHGPYRLPYFQQHRFVFYQNFQRLGVLGGGDDAIDWLLPLRTSPRAQHGGQASLQDAGHALFVNHGDVLHALSPVERRVLWTSTLDSQGTIPVSYPEAQHGHALQPLGSGGLLQSASLGMSPGPGGAAPVANLEYVCLLGRRTLTVRDALTGEALWTRERVPNQAQVFGTSDVIFLVTDGTEVTCLGARDGRTLDVEGAGELLRHAIHIGPEGVVVAEQKESRSLLGLGPTRHVLRLHDPASGRDLWTHEVRGGHYNVLGDGTIVVVESSGGLALIDVPSGERRRLTGLDAGAVRRQEEMAVLADYERIYLFVNRGGGYYSYSSGFLRTMQVNGMVYAFSRRTGEKVWEQRIDNQQLLMEQFAHSPLVVFSMHEYKQQDEFHVWEGRLLALDKGTGEVVVDSNMTNAFGYPFHSMALNLKDHAIDLITHNQRIRLSATLPADEPVEAPVPEEANR